MSALPRWEPLTTRWNPSKELEEMEKRLSTYLGRPALRSEGGKEAMTVAEWSPLVDITEDDKEYLIKADLPEVKKEDVKLTVQNDVMTISGERKSEKEEKGKKYHRVERA
ncbi:MAG: Hsp20 family protein, partial [Nitrospirae bacterium]|nr:Hsp20 family protein [Nitrospirota bacterium]